jgi:hypothetical protein
MHGAVVLAPALPPRVLLVTPDQWPRALMRAALREVGYDAVGTRSVGGAVHRAAPAPDRGVVGAVVIDQEAVGEDAGPIASLRQCAPDAAVVLLAPATRRVREGPWTRVIRRPVRVEEVVRLIEELVPLPASARRPLD